MDHSSHSFFPRAGLPLFFIVPAAVIVLAMTAPLPLHGVTCDGTEILCLDLVTAEEVEGSGGTVVGGDFNADGFMPHDGGGIDWIFGHELDFSTGRMEVDVKGLVPVDEDELRGGKVSIFSFCGLPPHEVEGMTLQKMAPDYRGGHCFRYGFNDDGPDDSDNWDAVVITGEGFGCPYFIDDPAWQPDETHHFAAEWSSAGLVLMIDDFRCEGRGNGDVFDPFEKMFVLANRCQHYPYQHAVARFSNLRLWGERLEPSCGNGACDIERREDCVTCPADCGPCPEPEEEGPGEIPEEADAPFDISETTDAAAGDTSSGDGPLDGAEASDQVVSGGCGCSIKR
jgi:hypothetical protein